ncbi:DUF2304 domain-containing protein [Mycetocola tolaasinivorans]|uniref:DUF2304 domain-containing protein n=1 Tax=Mycetocola tolaasinivorans TaxID=76635 RepID=A0A3L7A6P0_9MICO|nr:DUF2304 domain-containing protein [Mycetocola tolaasinivorans]RLP75996.1 DUF2304 domain-containing protein [Mycetocola tolaasinivorans]
MDNQFFIKAVLIAVFLIIGLFLVIPTRGARQLAVRRLTTLLLVLVAIFAVAFPDLINSLANLIGVGRGTDLLLYGLIVVFIGSSVTASRRYRQQEAQITDLARAVAIAQANHPAEKSDETP